jgi:hypothetical protein
MTLQPTSTTLRQRHLTVYIGRDLFGQLGGDLVVLRLIETTIGASFCQLRFDLCRWVAQIKQKITRDLISRAHNQLITAISALR